jgi:orotate phosphoribosyltransferase
MVSEIRGMEIAYELATKLLQINAIQLNPQNPFTWASGLKSPIYCDNRISLSYPIVRNFVKQQLAHKAKQFSHFQGIVGVATAGIPHGVLLADALQMPFAYIRSEPKVHGKRNQLEGRLPEGASVLVIEDLISTGGSALKACNSLKDIGYSIEGVLSLFTYGIPQSRIAFKESKIKYDSLSDFNTLLSVAEHTGQLSNKDIHLLLKWQEDPIKWSSDFDGKS